MSIHLYTSNRTESLADLLCQEVLSARPRDIFHPEVIVINSRGMEAWLKQAIGARTGICCNVSFPFLSVFIDELLARVPDLAPEAAAAQLYSRRILHWRIADVLGADQVAPEAVLAPCRAYIGTESRALRTWQLAGRIAHLFDQYQVFRPDLIRCWERGMSAALGPDEAWQRHIWGRLRQMSEAPTRLDRFERFAEAADALDLTGLERVSLFGLTTMPPIFLHLLCVLSRRVPVHLFFLNPCREDWHLDLTERARDRLASRLASEGVDHPDMYVDAGNPLLSSLGTVGREFMVELLDQTEYSDVDAFDPGPGGTLLQRVQYDICCRTSGGPPTDPARTDGSPAAISATDRTIWIHACHSPMREIEVLHDCVLSCLDDDASLQPRDILVMAPDISVYAPYIDAVFGDPDPDTAAPLPYTIADRTAAGESACVDALMGVLNLPRERFRASLVLDLLDVEPVRRAAGLSDADVDLVRHWVEDAGIRWGIDAEHRAALGLPAYEETSWRFGLERMLLGYAISNRDTPATDLICMDGRLPFDDIEGDTAHQLGRFSAWVQRLADRCRQLTQSRSPAAWSTLLDHMILDLFDPTGAHADVQLLRETVLGLAEDAERAGCDDPLPIDVVASYLQAALESTSAGRGFFRGGITFCSLLPMRSIPVRVIWLLGMNDGEFPRRDTRLGFDLLKAAPRRCDRSRTLDDRYLFLEALLSARDRFCLSYAGRTITDNTKLPPSTVVCELRDYLNGAYDLPPGHTDVDGEPLLHIETHHPLHPFSVAYFDGSRPDLFSYSAANAGAARAAADQSRPAPFVEWGLPHDDLPCIVPLPDADSPVDVDVSDLTRFFRNPSRFFLRHCLAVDLGRDPGASVDDRELFDLDGLAAYAVDRDLFDLFLAGVDEDTARTLLRAKAALPPGAVGDQLFGERAHQVRYVLERVFPENACPGLAGLSVQQVLEAAPDAIRVRLDPFELTPRTVLVTGSFDLFRGTTQVLWRPGIVRPRDRFEAFVHHLILAASGHVPATDAHTLFVGRDRACRFPPLPATAARAHLRDLLELYLDGLQAPLPFAPECTEAYCRGLLRGDTEEDARQRAARAWAGSEFSPRPGEGEDADLRLCLGTDGPMELPRFGAIARVTFGCVLEQEEELPWP